MLHFCSLQDLLNVCWANSTDGPNNFNNYVKLQYLARVSAGYIALIGAWQVFSDL